MTDLAMFSGLFLSQVMLIYFLKWIGFKGIYSEKERADLSREYKKLMTAIGTSFNLFKLLDFLERFLTKIDKSKK